MRKSKGTTIRICLALSAFQGKLDGLLVTNSSGKGRGFVA